MMPLSPGFATPVHDAQQTFRQLLGALSHPGKIYQRATPLAPPAGLTATCAAACLTLLDLETKVWLPPDCPQSIMTWLSFHTGARRSSVPSHAGFAILNLAVDASLPELNAFSSGTATDPEAACTLLVQVPSLDGGQTARLRGPGIQTTAEIAPQVPATFWQWWADNHAQYPLGVDVFLFSPDQLMGLPRSVIAEATERIVQEAYP